MEYIVHRPDSTRTHPTTSHPVTLHYNRPHSTQFIQCYPLCWLWLFASNTYPSQPRTALVIVECITPRVYEFLLNRITAVGRTKLFQMLIPAKLTGTFQHLWVFTLCFYYYYHCCYSAQRCLVVTLEIYILLCSCC